METSAPKRRKTSPTTSLPVSESQEPSSDSATRRSSRLNRSSASPAAASLAKSNSDTFQQRTTSRGSQLKKASGVPAASELDNPTSNNGDTDGPSTAQPELESDVGSLQRMREGRNGAARVGRPKGAVKKVGGGLSIRPKRSPNKPSPRPLPPPSAEEEELVNPFKGRRLRRSPPPGVLLEVEPEEPELPPTPTQKGLADPSSIVTSSVGIHNTPSKRPKRSRILAARMNSSPLKQPPLYPSDQATEGIEETGGAVASSSAHLAKKDPLRSEPKRKPKKRKLHPARQIEEADPLADKRAIRDALLSEVAALEDDLKVVSRENERLYEVQGPGRQRRTADLLPGPEEQRHLLDVLRRHALPPEKEEPPDVTQNWLEAAMNPIAFLPFGRANTVTLPPLVAPSEKPAGGEENPSPPPSHHPVPMTAEEELPYLQVFAPLTFTSTITTVRQERPGKEAGEGGREAEDDSDDLPLAQRHMISVASSPPGLFAATIDMTVDTRSLAIAELSVPRLDPSAIGELGPFLKEKGLLGNKLTGNTNATNSALTRNVTVVAWTMGEWLRVAMRRARFWHTLTRDLGTAEQLLRCAAAMRQRSMTGKGKKGRSRADDDDSDDDGDGDGDGEGGGQKTHPTMADVVALLGRTSLDLDLSSVANGGQNNDDEDEESLVLRIQWRIDFDWTGEARSKMGLLLSAPAKWRATDAKGSLAGIPDMFDKLVREKKEDPVEAVKTVVALIVGDGLA